MLEISVITDINKRGNVSTQGIIREPQKREMASDVNCTKIVVKISQIHTAAAVDAT
jgi:hypothetical protein